MRGLRGTRLARLAGVALLVGLVGAAAPGYAGGGTTDSVGDAYTVLDVKTNNIKDAGTLIRVSVSYSCPAGAQVLVQASLNGLRFVGPDGVLGVGSFGAIDQTATCTGHRQKTELALPIPPVLAGGLFIPTSGVRAFGFLREVPTSDAVHQGGPFVIDLHGPPIQQARIGNP